MVGRFLADFGFQRRSRPPFQTRLYRPRPWGRTSCMTAMDGGNATGLQEQPLPMQSSSLRSFGMTKEEDALSRRQKLGYLLSPLHVFPGIRIHFYLFTHGYKSGNGDLMTGFQDCGFSAP